MVRTLSKLAILLALALVVVGGTVTSAGALTPNEIADLAPDENMGTSTTNPGIWKDMDTWWRAGWGKSDAPQFILNTPSVEDTTFGLLAGMVYTVTTTPQDLNPSTPGLYYRSGRPEGTNLGHTFDLPGIYRFPPVGGWRAVPTTGAASDYEGYWYINFLWFTTTGYCSTDTYHGRFGIDQTPPSRVDSLCVSPTDMDADATTILPTTRAHVLWKLATDYDALSGVAYYQLLIDGVNAVPEKDDDPEQGRAYVIPSFHPRSITVEDLPPGKHVIGIAPVDRATNMGPIASVTMYSDPDTPTITFRTPTSYWLPRVPQLSVVASDAGGIRNVVYRLDGHPIATTVVGPYYTARPDLKYFPKGWHELSATVTDMYGRTAVVKKTVRLDKVAPTIKVSVSVNKLKVTVRATTSEAGAIRFWCNGSLTSTEGKEVIKYLTKKGTRSVTFRVDRAGYGSNAYYSGVRVPWSVQSVDYAGNYSKYRSGRKTVRYYRIVKTAQNQVKVINY